MSELVKRPFGRILQIHFRNDNGEKYTLGRESIENPLSFYDNPQINVKVEKTMTTSSDYATIEIKNISPDAILQIMHRKFDDVEIKAGYQTQGATFSIFRGRLLNIGSNWDNDDGKTLTCYMLVVSFLRADLKALNLSMSSNINVYQCLKEACLHAGYNNVHISDKLSLVKLTDIENIDTNVASWMNAMSLQKKNIGVCSDSSLGSIIKVIDLDNLTNADCKIYNLDTNYIDFREGRPTLTKDGANMNLLVIRNYMPTDIIKIDNSMFNLTGNGGSAITTLNSDNSTTLNGRFLDDDGLYFIMKVQYLLSSREGDFTCNIQCKAKSMMSLK